MNCYYQYTYGPNWLGKLLIIKECPGFFVCKRVNNGDIVHIFKNELKPW